MNVDDEVEVGRTLEQTDIATAVFVPNSLIEVLEAVGLPQYMLYAKRGATALCASREALSRVPLRVFQVAVGVDVKRFPV